MFEKVNKIRLEFNFLSIFEFLCNTELGYFVLKVFNLCVEQDLQELRKPLADSHDHSLEKIGNTI